MFTSSLKIKETVVETGAQAIVKKGANSKSSLKIKETVVETGGQAIVKKGANSKSCSLV